MKKSFTGPIWLLVVFAVLQAYFSYSIILAVARGFNEMDQGHLIVFVLRLMMWPLIVIGEALVYWVIRKRNHSRLLSWTHAVIFCLAFVLNGLVAAIAILHEPMNVALRTRQGRVAEQAIFWALVILSHVAFIQVLILAFRKQPPVRKPGEQSENLLDDVVL